MRHLGDLSRVILLLVLCAFAGAGASLANVIGIERYQGFAAVTYSGDVAITGDMGKIVGRTYRGLVDQRTDFTYRGQPYVAVGSLETQTGFLASPALGMITYVKLYDYGVRDWIPQLEQHRDVLIEPAGEGAQEVNGEMATRYLISGSSPEGTAYNGNLWMTDDGIVVRIEVQIATEHSPLTYNLTNLERGEQPNSLFVRPTGLQQVPWAQVVATLF